MIVCVEIDCLAVSGRYHFTYGYSKVGAGVRFYGNIYHTSKYLLFVLSTASTLCRLYLHPYLKKLEAAEASKASTFVNSHTYCVGRTSHHLRTGSYSSNWLSRSSDPDQRVVSNRFLYRAQLRNSSLLCIQEYRGSSVTCSPGEPIVIQSLGRLKAEL
jgi:hypothetical protein